MHSLWFGVRRDELTRMVKRSAKLNQYLSSHRPSGRTYYTLLVIPLHQRRFIQRNQ